MSKYVIEPMSLISFLEDSKLRLPRFQRKATWDKKQNFELAISVFQDYPVGVVIVNQEQKVSWLLDGRQRRSALIAMRNNPVELYDWARTYIGFNKTADEFDITEKYWGKVDKFLQATEKTEDKEDEEEQYGGDEEEIEENSFDSARQRQGLQTLLDLILMVHQVKPSGSKWEKLFDFRDYIPRLKYAPNRDNPKIEPILLRRFIMELIKELDERIDSERTIDFFIDYYERNFDITDQEKFEKDVTKRWAGIEDSLDVIDRSEKIFADARIGIIRLTNATALDAQNIFSRINKGGTQLKAEELLSAKPYWNTQVSGVAPIVSDAVKELYKRLGITAPDTVVRWDIAATLISRIDDNNLIFDSFDESKKNDEISMKEISLGFKLLSSIYTQGMANKHVIELEKNDSIRWEYDIDSLVNELNTVCQILMNDTMFKYLQSWKCPIMNLLGNAVALEFITVMLLDWRSKGSPKAISAEMKAVQRDARILFDRLVFEYASRTWRGSGDSKMSNDIKNWRSRLVPIDEADWHNYISGACKGNYNGIGTTVKMLRPVLYYYYAITECAPLNQVDVSFDIDHIVPQERFVGNSMINLSWKDSLINLALLPTKENISKRAKSLQEITDGWLKQQISIFTGISETEFPEFSNVSCMQALYEERSKLFLTAFGSNRKAVLSK